MAFEAITDVFIGLMVVSPVVVWLLIAGSPLRRVIGAAGLSVLDALLFAVSQLQPGVLPPPLIEWGVACGVAGSVVVLVLHRTWRRGMPSPNGPQSWLLPTLALPLSLIICSCGAGYLREAAGELPEGFLWSHVEPAEYLPLPAGTQLVGTDYNGLSQGPSILELSIAATDAATSQQLATRLGEYYSTRGWHLNAERSSVGVVYRGCRRVQGLIRWADHCMRFGSSTTHTWILVSVSVDGMSDRWPSSTPRG